MKRRIWISSVFVMLLLLLGGCGNKTNTKANTYQIVKKTESATMAPTKIVVETMRPVVKEEKEQEQSVPVVSAQIPQKQSVRINRNMKQMTPVFTTIALYMAEGRTYDQSDEECFWRIMAMLMNTREDLLADTQYEERNEMVYVDEEAMFALSDVAFLNHAPIEKVAKARNPYIEYHKEDKKYVTNEVDPADVTGRINRVVKEWDGAYTVSFDLLDNEGQEVINSFEFEIIENKDKHQSSSPKFSYRVKSVKKLGE